MATTSPLQGIPVSEGTDQPNEPAQLSSAVNALEKQIVQVYADTATRNAVLSAPKEGMVCWVKNIDTMQYFDGTAWRAFSDHWGGAPGFGAGPTPVIGSTKFEFAAYVEAATDAFGKLTLHFPDGFASLIDFQISQADGGGASLAHSYNLYILVDNCSGVSAQIQARNVDATGTALGNKFVGFTYHAVLQ